MGIKSTKLVGGQPDLFSGKLIKKSMVSLFLMLLEHF